MDGLSCGHFVAMVFFVGEAGFSNQRLNMLVMVMVPPSPGGLINPHSHELKLVNVPGIKCKDVEKYQNINQNAMNEYYYNIL